MEQTTGKQVIGVDGALGTIAPRSDDPEGRVTVRLDDGREMLVPSSALKRQDDGTFQLSLRRQDMEKTGGPPPVSIPVVEEELVVDKRQVPTGGVRVNKLIHEHDETVTMPLTRDQVDVRRVLIGRDVDGPMPVRREGDTIIVPVVEEVLVVEKRLRLKEEVYISRKQVQENHEEKVTLRSEEAVVERVDSEGNAVRREAPPESPPPRKTILREQPARTPKRRNRILPEN